MKNSNFFAELKRRNVYKIAVACAVASWSLIQIAAQVLPLFEISNWTLRPIIFA
jgi:adenylate cyclase